VFLHELVDAQPSQYGRAEAVALASIITILARFRSRAGAKNMFRLDIPQPAYTSAGGDEDEDDEVC
jgi:hypothetical protein